MAHRKLVKGSAHIGSQKQIKVYYRELCSIKKAHGILTAEVVISAARDKDNPLNGCFQWHDGKAAHLYRLTQARLLIRSVHYEVVEGDGGGPSIVRAFHLVEDQQKTGNAVSHYVTVAEVQRKSHYRMFVVEQAMLQMQGWTKKYGRYRALFPIVKATKQVRKRLQP